ncbi:MAG: sugar ABC transporter ATP-binding protein [Verrucomicrobia bacterium]|nr:sugar ABC transporter ATP-binding protein [Verrucomicrobiota bacterium]
MNVIANTETSGHTQSRNNQPLLRFEHVVKQFGGTLAVNDVTLDLYSHEVLALLGGNGAGKSTLIKMLAGVYTPTSGQIFFRDQPVSHIGGKPPIAFIHQDLGLIEWMTVAENLAFGLGFPRRAGLIQWKNVSDQAEEALARVGGGISPSTRIHRLSRTDRSLVAIARALAANAELLVLDEPTSSLPAADVDRLFVVLDGLRARGIGMLYVSHRLDEIFRQTDRTAVMRDGRLVAVFPTRQTTPQELVTLIVGHKIAEIYPRAPQPDKGEPMLETRDLSLSHLAPVTFELKRGEMLGLTGLKGAGQAEVGRALFGLDQPEHGEIRLEGHLVALNSPRLAMQKGIGFVSSNRQVEGLAMNLTVRENFFLNPQNRGCKWYQPIDPKQEKAEAEVWVGRYDVRPKAPEQTIETLSGGNQQKVVVGRWLEFATKVLILDEPTVGIDVGSKAEIYAFLIEVLKRGVSVLMISTDFEEIANVCHRALVFNRGRIVAEILQGQLSVSQLLHAAAGE